MYKEIRENVAIPRPASLCMTPTVCLHTYIHAHTPGKKCLPVLKNEAKSKTEQG